MTKEQGKSPGRYLFFALILIAVALISLQFFIEDIRASYYDNTTVETRLNVTNVAPRIENIMIYDNDTLNGAPNIILTQGVTDTVYCNATITDLNGYNDIIGFNMTFFHTSTSYTASDDNNNHYTNQSCINTTISGNLTSINVQCSFQTWFYANNGTWYCNVTAIDKDSAINYSNGTKIIDPLYALDLNTTLIDYGELAPGDSSSSDVPVKITNFGNMNINISVEGYGISLHDNLSMDCDTGNISVRYEKYAITSGLPVLSMSNLTTNPLLNGITGLTIEQNTDDSGNSTNTTYWKMEVPIKNGLKGFCNGTTLFSAVGAE